MCVKGKYVAVTGSQADTACIDCGAGKYVNVQGSDAESACTDCAGGKYVEQTGATSCKGCPPGKFTSGENRELPLYLGRW
jgi:hypothetical protein